MRITTWNVNGLRALRNKGADSWIMEYSPDVLCLQEIKSRREQVESPDTPYLPEYQASWNPALRPGYSGVASFSRIPPIEQQHGMGREEYDQEGRIIWQRFDGFVLFNVYFPNGQRDQGRLDYKLAFYAALLEVCNQMHASGDQIVICGDFNTAHREIDLRNPKSNQTTSGFLPEERAWLDRYLEAGFEDAYRNLYPERVQYTWWTYISNARQRNVGWRLDFFMVSRGLMPSVEDVIIHDDILGSDHCPVTLIIS